MGNVALIYETSRGDPLIRRIDEILNRLGHVVLYPDDLKLGQTILGSIIRNLQACDAAVVVISMGRPNIYYELGILGSTAKPHLLLINERVEIPTDLLGTAYIAYDGRSAKTASFTFKLEAQISALISGRVPGTPVDQDYGRRDAAFRRPGASIQRIISSEDPKWRSEHLEVWLQRIASQVHNWDVITRDGGRDEGYDLAVWSSITDSLLTALGNPILFEVKASTSLDRALLERVAAIAARSNLKSFVLVTLGALTERLMVQAAQIYKSKHIIPVVLDRESLRMIEHPSDLVDQIRFRAAQVLRIGGRGV